MNIYQKITEARASIELDSVSGFNQFSDYKYIELADFLPAVKKKEQELGLFSSFSLRDGIAELSIVNTEKADEEVIFSIPTAEVQVKGCSLMQNIGAVATYARRYLYIIAYNLVEPDMLDSAKKEEIEEIDYSIHPISKRHFSEYKIEKLAQIIEAFKSSENLMYQKYLPYAEKALAEKSESQPAKTKNTEPKDSISLFDLES